MPSPQPRHTYIYIGPQNRTFFRLEGCLPTPNTSQYCQGSSQLRPIEVKGHWLACHGVLLDRLFTWPEVISFYVDIYYETQLLAVLSSLHLFPRKPEQWHAVAHKNIQKNTILLVAFGNVRVFQRDSSLEMLRISMIYLWSESQYSTLRCCSYPSSTVCHLHNRALLESRWSSGWCIQKPWASRISRPLDVLLIESCLLCLYNLESTSPIFYPTLPTMDLVRKTLHHKKPPKAI